MKKVLSFVLVLAMILGSVSMVFASSFTDDTTITNKEAAAVLSAAGVIEGYPDGSFKPEGILTRAEGAAILARMVLGKSDAAKLTTVVSPFNDVPATHWAAGAISYCVAQGFIDGYGNGNFGPDDTLTVAAFGKMMLTAVGYKSANEGFTGDAWETNVGSVMVKAGLTDGVTITGSNACTRGTAAQVALNTLKADLVEYDGTPVSVSTGSVTVTTGQSAAKKVAAPAGENGNYKNAADGIRQFMEEYQKDLKLSANQADDFGRPNANQWTYKNENVFKTVSSKNLIASYNNKVTQDTIYKLLKSHDATTANITFWNDGVDTVTGAPVPAGFDGSAAAAYGSGNGTKTEVYYEAATAVTPAKVTVVVVNYYLAQAVGDYKASSDELKVSVNGVNKTLEGKDFAIKDAKDEDYFVVTLANGTVKTFDPANSVTGTITAYKVNSDVTIDGTKYEKSAAAFGTDVDLSAPVTGTEIKLIVDQNGYILATKDVTSDTQFVYIKKIAGTSGLNTDYVADAFFLDGTRSEIKLKKVATKDPAIYIATPGNDTPETWFNYSINAKGEYTLTVPAGGISVAAAVSEIKSKDANFTNGDIAGISASNSTVFVVLDKNNNVKVYTGIKNVPNTSGVNAGVAYVKDKDALTFAKYVFIDAKGSVKAGTGNATLVGAASSDYIVLYKGTTLGKMDNGTDKYYSYSNAVINGEAKTIEFAEEANVVPAVVVGLYNQLSYDANGRIDNATKVIDINDALTPIADDKNQTDDFDYYAAVVATGTAISYKSGVLTVDNGTTNYKVVDGTTAFVMNSIVDHEKLTDGVKLDKIMSNLDAGGTYMVYLALNSDNEVKAVYFVRYL